jgi:dipeptidyl aminopeptidase/acylaminoacyl peptidase
VRYEARDGLMIEGLLILPVDHRQGERYPLIVQVHGGPEAHYSNGWLTHYNLPGQVAAGRGYAVFYPNYRASTGRGVAFTKLDHEDPAGKEFDDIVDGVDHLIERGLVDRDRVGVTGGSYGGYATAWGATYYSERFAAGVMSVGISDATMMMALGDIPWEMYLVHLRVWPWEDWDLYRERSPLYHTPKSRTPLLILHGEADTRVHPGHSLALYRMLKVQDNAPVRLVLYPGEGHGNQRAASRYDYSLRLMQWMEHYLIGDGGDPPAYELDYSAIKPADGDDG